jgi:hypothetical protein
MADANLKLIAESRADDPLNTWPDHTHAHSRTLLGNFLWDFHCLRCWLEKVATERLEAKKVEAAPAAPAPAGKRRPRQNCLKPGEAGPC